ncbi:MAG: outer membrane beta-barrel protein [Paludibacteraceae bacterium]
MKKSLILFLCLITSFGVFAQDYKNWSKWSITLEGGANVLDGDVFQDYNQVSPTSKLNLSFGGSIEYTLTPAWSMGVDYYYLPLKASSTTPAYNVNTKLHNVDYFMAVNFVKLFYRRSTSKFGFWPTVGVGGAFYNVEYTTDKTSLDDNQNQKDDDYIKKNGRSLVFPLGILAEYNLSKNLALGVKVQYRVHSDDNLDGRDNRGVTNDGVALGTLQLRWKFNAKNNDHTRNINVAQFDDDVTRDDLKKLEEKLQKKIDSIPTPIDYTPQLKDLDKRVKKLEDYLDIDGPDDDNDGVSNNRGMKSQILRQTLL